MQRAVRNVYIKHHNKITGPAWSGAFETIHQHLEIESALAKERGVCGSCEQEKNC